MNLKNSRYFALKPMTTDGVYYDRGDELPSIATWTAKSSLIRSGRVLEVIDIDEFLAVIQAERDEYEARVAAEELTEPPRKPGRPRKELING